MATRLDQASLSTVVDEDVLNLAKDSLAKASTPEPFSTSKTSNWVAKNGGLPNYIQHVAHGIQRSGKSESQAIQIAIGKVRDWAEGKGDVDEGTRAAAKKAMAEWEALKAKNKAKGAAKLSLDAEVHEGRLALALQDARRARLDLAVIDFDPKAHPRDMKGQWRKAVGGLADNQTVRLPDGTEVTNELTSGTGPRAGRKYRVKAPNGDEFTTRKPGDAADSALEHSSKSMKPESLGGGVKHSSVDNAIKAHKAIEKDPRVKAAGESDAQAAEGKSYTTTYGNPVTAKDLDAGRMAPLEGGIAMRRADGKYVVQRGGGVQRSERDDVDVFDTADEALEAAGQKKPPLGDDQAAEADDAERNLKEGRAPDEPEKDAREVIDPADDEATKDKHHFDMVTKTVDRLMEGGDEGFTGSADEIRDIFREIKGEGDGSMDYEAQTVLDEIIQATAKADGGPDKELNQWATERMRAIDENDPELGAALAKMDLEEMTDGPLAGYDSLSQALDENLSSSRVQVEHETPDSISFNLPGGDDEENDYELHKGPGDHVITDASDDDWVLTEYPLDSYDDEIDDHDPEQLTHTNLGPDINEALKRLDDILKPRYGSSPRERRAGKNAEDRAAAAEVGTPSASGEGEEGFGYLGDRDTAVHEVQDYLESELEGLADVEDDQTFGSELEGVGEQLVKEFAPDFRDPSNVPELKPIRGGVQLADGTKVYIKEGRVPRVVVDEPDEPK